MVARRKILPERLQADVSLPQITTSDTSDKTLLHEEDYQ